MSVLPSYRNQSIDWASKLIDWPSNGLKKPTFVILNLSQGKIKPSIFNNSLLNLRKIYYYWNLFILICLGVSSTVNLPAYNSKSLPVWLTMHLMYNILCSTTIILQFVSLIFYYAYLICFANFFKVCVFLDFD